MSKQDDQLNHAVKTISIIELMLEVGINDIDFLKQIIAKFKETQLKQFLGTTLTEPDESVVARPVNKNNCPFTQCSHKAAKVERVGTYPFYSIINNCGDLDSKFKADDK